MVTASEVSTTLGLVDLSLIETEFRSQLSVARLFPGAALAVYRHGELALDLVGGYADTQSGELVHAGERGLSPGHLGLRWPIHQAS